jgi:hypothetical protein
MSGMTTWVQHTACVRQKKKDGSRPEKKNEFLERDGMKSPERHSNYLWEDKNNNIIEVP